MATLCPPSKEGLSGTLRSREDFIKVCLLLLVGVPTEPSSPYPTKGKESKKGHAFYFIHTHTYCVSEGEGVFTACGNWFPLSTVWVPGIKLNSSELGSSYPYQLSHHWP